MDIITKHYESAGTAENIVLGFVPTYARIFNNSATTGEVMVIDWFGVEMGDNIEFHTSVTASGSYTGMAYASSGGYISEYDTFTVTSGTAVSITGGKGITIAADFQDNGDEIYIYAVRSSVDTDLGDLA